MRWGLCSGYQIARLYALKMQKTKLKRQSSWSTGLVCMRASMHAEKGQVMIDDRV